MIREYFQTLSKPRISRHAYINWFIFAVSIQVIVSLYHRVTPATGFEELDFWLLVFGILLFLSNLIIVVRRLHDQNRSGWWLLLFCVPVVGIVWLLIWCLFIPGTNGENRFGPDPRPITRSETQGLSEPTPLNEKLNHKAPSLNDDRVPCPECAEMIKVNAIKCRFCGIRV